MRVGTSGSLCRYWVAVARLADLLRSHACVGRNGPIRASPSQPRAVRPV